MFYYKKITDLEVIHMASSCIPANTEGLIEITEEEYKEATENEN